MDTQGIKEHLQEITKTRHRRGEEQQVVNESDIKKSVKRKLNKLASDVRIHLQDDNLRSVTEYGSNMAQDYREFPMHDETVGDIIKTLSDGAEYVPLNNFESDAHAIAYQKGFANQSGFMPRESLGAAKGNLKAAAKREDVRLAKFLEIHGMTPTTGEFKIDVKSALGVMLDLNHPDGNYDNLRTINPRLYSMARMIRQRIPKYIGANMQNFLETEYIGQYTTSQSHKLKLDPEQVKNQAQEFYAEHGSINYNDRVLMGRVTTIGHREDKSPSEIAQEWGTPIRGKEEKTEPSEKLTYITYANPKEYEWLGIIKEIIGLRETGTMESVEQKMKLALDKMPPEYRSAQRQKEIER